MSPHFVAEAEALLTRLSVLAERCGEVRPSVDALREACTGVYEALAARVAATGHGLSVHTDGEAWFLDGQRVAFDAFAHARVQKAMEWMQVLGANELRATPPLPPSAVTVFAEELALALEGGALRPTLADQRPGRIVLRARPALQGRAEQDVSVAEGVAADLETLAGWCEAALPVATSVRPDMLVPRRALWRVRARASTDASAAFAIALRSDPSDSLSRHLARTAVLATTLMTGLGLEAVRTVEGTLSALSALLCLGELRGAWWRAEPSGLAEALLARHRLGVEGCSVAGVMLAQDLALLFGSETGAEEPSPSLSAQVFVASAWLDRARNGLHVDLPRCTPLQARAALDVWARRRGRFAPGLTTAMGALLGAVPPGSVVRAGGLAGVLRGANEVAAVDGEGRVSLFIATSVSAACSEPAGVPQGYFACPPSLPQG